MRAQILRVDIIERFTDLYTYTVLHYSNSHLRVQPSSYLMWYTCHFDLYSKRIPPPRGGPYSAQLLPTHALFWCTPWCTPHILVRTLYFSAYLITQCTPLMTQCTPLMTQCTPLTLVGTPHNSVHTPPSIKCMSSP